MVWRSVPLLVFWSRHIECMNPESMGLVYRFLFQSYPLVAVKNELRLWEFCVNRIYSQGTLRSLH